RNSVPQRAQASARFGTTSDTAISSLAISRTTAGRQNSCCVSRITSAIFADLYLEVVNPTMASRQPKPQLAQNLLPQSVTKNLPVGFCTFSAIITVSASKDAPVT